MPDKNPLDISSAALDQIIKYLTRGPIIMIIGFLIVTNTASLIFAIKVLYDSRDRENVLNKQTIDLINDKVDQRVEEKVAPVEQKVLGTVNNLDSSISRLDSIIIKRATNEK